MSEEVTSSVGPKPKASGTGVPGAIVVAGVLIALAIFFSNRAPAGMSSGDNVSAQPTPAAPIIAAMRPVDETDHVRGPADAKITIIEYSDLECPFCERFHPTMEQLIKEYPNDVRWVYRHFPLAIHPGARAKSHAAECAAEQGLFWEFTDTLFKAGTSWLSSLSKLVLLTLLRGKSALMKSVMPTTLLPTSKTPKYPADAVRPIVW
jgi:protein-disulfide isomerase